MTRAGSPLPASWRWRLNGTIFFWRESRSVRYLEEPIVRYTLDAVLVLGVAVTAGARIFKPEE